MLQVLRAGGRELGAEQRIQQRVIVEKVGWVVVEVGCTGARGRSTGMSSP
jgi:hypothetical protein